MNFFIKNPNLQKKKVFFCFFSGGGVGGGGGVDGWTDKQAQTNLSLGDVGSNLQQCINVQVKSRTSSIYDHFII